VKIKPRKSDIEWTKGLIDTLTDTGIWVIPNNMSVFKFDKAGKRYMLVLGDSEDMTNKIAIDILENHLRYTRVTEPPPEWDVADIETARKIFGFVSPCKTEERPKEEGEDV
jgi:hypothetical protein